MTKKDWVVAGVIGWLLLLCGGGARRAAGEDLAIRPALAPAR